MKLYRLFLGSLALLGSGQAYGGGYYSAITNLASNGSGIAVWTATGCAEPIYKGYGDICTYKTVSMDAINTQYHYWPHGVHKEKLHFVDYNGKKWVYDDPPDFDKDGWEASDKSDPAAFGSSIFSDNVAMNQYSPA